MTNSPETSPPTNSPDATPPNISDVAAESPEESVEKERGATEEFLDTGDSVPEDDSL
ncbi:hypothetical protein [Ornithinimicrobium pratense]|uniref:hypothetical protein n=1 Tax=Ornithinimicrobium pratense TaxID=2593973 RepID=UPI001787F118|nr:hypothetical protein [Ornithinimicrobium pratense]